MRPHPARAAARRRRLLRRRLLAAALVFTLAVVLGASGALGLAWLGTGLVQRRAVDGLSAQAGPRRVLNVLVVGNDSREGLSPRQVRAFGTGQAEGDRTDTIMLVQVEVNGAGRAAVLSFPRDLRVQRCDGSTGRINAAYGIGLRRDGDGPSCVVQTVTRLTGLQVHHYVEVSFAGFVEFVDALGGVPLYLEEPLYDEKAHLDLPAGCVTLRGADALGFVRARHLDNDFGRIARQQRFVKEALRQATSLGVLANPARLAALVQAAAGAVETDDGLGLAEMRALAAGLRGLSADKVHVHTVPAVDQQLGGVWYVEQLPEAEALYEAFRDGEALRGKPEPPEPPPPPVTVLNADGTPGLAAAAAAVLEAEDIPVAEVGNASRTGAPLTEVHHPPHLKDEADDVLRALDAGILVEEDARAEFVVELGADLDLSELTETAAQAEAGADGREGRAGQPTEAPAPPPAYRGAGDSGVDC